MVFKTTLRRILRQPINLVFIMIFPVICYILLSASTGGETREDINLELKFGIVDNDNSNISRTLANQLGLRYNIVEVEEADIIAKLTDQHVPWILQIKEGYENEVLSGKELTTLEGYSLTISDMSELGAVSAESITRALMILGTNDEKILSEWEEAARVEMITAEAGDNWPVLVQWLSMFGFAALFTAYFIIKTLHDDKRFGMPDRVGVLPMSPRKYLVQGALAAFVATEISVVLTLVSMTLVLGAIANLALLFLLMSAFNLFAVSLVLAVISIAKDLGAISVFITMFATLSSMLGGLMWPIEFVPEFMQRVAWFTPGYWFSEGLKNIREITFEGFGMPMLFLAGFTIVTLIVGGFGSVQRAND